MRPFFQPLIKWIDRIDANPTSAPTGDPAPMRIEYSRLSDHNDLTVGDIRRIRDVLAGAVNRDGIAPMTANDLRAFIAHMGWSERGTARRLGCSQNGLRGWLAKDSVPLYISLACAALAFGLPPWRP